MHVQLYTPILIEGHSGFNMDNMPVAPIGYNSPLNIDVIVDQASSELALVTNSSGCTSSNAISDITSSIASSFVPSSSSSYSLIASSIVACSPIASSVGLSSSSSSSFYLFHLQFVTI